MSKKVYCSECYYFSPAKKSSAIGKPSIPEKCNSDIAEHTIVEMNKQTSYRDRPETSSVTHYRTPKQLNHKNNCKGFKTKGRAPIIF